MRKKELTLKEIEKLGYVDAKNGLKVREDYTFKPNELAVGEKLDKVNAYWKGRIKHSMKSAKQLQLDFANETINYKNSLKK